MAGMGYPGGVGGGGGAMQCVSKVELRIECLNLRNRDAMSKSDPCAVLFLHNGHKWQEVGKTTTCYWWGRVAGEEVGGGRGERESVWKRNVAKKSVMIIPTVVVFFNTV